jgi:hypothetical protein
VSSTRHLKMESLNAENDSEFDFCHNCQRRHVDLEERPWEEIRKLISKTYFAVSPRRETVNLCSCCNCYLQVGSKAGHWPAMIWIFLSSNPTVNVQSIPPWILPQRDRWKYIPYQWRGWWLEAMQSTGVTMMEPTSEVFDVTADKVDLESALSSLCWKKMAPAMDKYLPIPTVRCPWGCGAYLHQTNEVPYEDLLLAKSNYSFRSTSKCSGRQQRRKWTDSARPDFPSSSTILENDKFVCRPSIVLKDDGPYLLCCKKHDQKTIERVVHLPTNPTGSLFTDSSNQFAPVVLKSRTLRKAKLNQYSDTYKTVELRGGYDGIDSAFCCAVGNHHVANHLSRERETTCLYGDGKM